MSEDTTNDGVQAEGTSRRQLLGRAGLVGAAVWAAPVVQTLGMSSASAAVGSPPPGGGRPGTITGTVVDAQTGAPIAGAVITVQTTGFGAVTAADGTYTIPGVPPGSYTVQAAATGFQNAISPAVVPDGGTVTVNFSLSALGDAVRAVLAWGATPSDLDLHMSGPDGDGGRFHAAYYDRTPTDFVSLDRDDTSSFGPETDTVTVSPTHGNTYVAGSYHVWVHNFSTSPEFDTSGATLTLFGPGGQIGVPYSVAAATGNPAEDIWYVVTFDLSSAGVVSNVSAQQVFQAGNSSTVL